MKLAPRIIRTGITRTVILVGPWAIKLPAVRNGYRIFLQGMLANLQERAWWRDAHRGPLGGLICPVLWGDPFGLLVVMPRLPDLQTGEMPPRWHYQYLPLDYKRDNFGWYEDRVVLRDYGS